MLPRSSSPTTGLIQNFERHNRSGDPNTSPPRLLLNSCAGICGVAAGSAYAGALFTVYVSTNPDISLGAKHGIFWGGVAILIGILCWCRSTVINRHPVNPPTLYSSTTRNNRIDTNIFDPELFKTAEPIALSMPVVSDEEVEDSDCRYSS